MFWFGSGVPEMLKPFYFIVNQIKTNLFVEYTMESGRIKERERRESRSI